MENEIAIPEIAAAAGAEIRAPRAQAQEPSPAPSDAALCEAVAERIGTPKVAEADSFVLHAPLELLARAALLPLVRPEAREAARRRLARLGETYAAAGPEVPEPTSSSAYDSAEAALAHLGAAIEACDVDAVDLPARWLAAALPADELARRLADVVLPSLAAAAHGAIFLWQLPRVAPRSAAAARMLRSLARELAREGSWRLAWYRDRDARRVDVLGDSAASGSGASSTYEALLEALIAPPSPGDPGSNFIYPTMSLVERSGLARERLGGATASRDVAGASRALARVAAWSMLQDDPAHAPYGWTHALSMPQAALGIAGACAEPSEAIAVAATYVLGFRATLSARAIDPAWAPEPPSHREWLLALAGSPAEAAAAAWHAPREAEAAVVAAIATRAALHQDAHLAKYTVACLDAAHGDRSQRRLYLAAAAYLGAWWAARTGEGEAI